MSCRPVIHQGQHQVFTHGLLQKSKFRLNSAMQTKLKRPAILLLITLIGAPLGYFARGAMQQPQDRPAETIKLFTTYCLPMAKGQESPDPEDLIELTDIPHAAEWIDPTSKLLLARNPQSCSVSDELVRFSATERAALETTVPDLVQKSLPGFKSAPPELPLDNWDLFQMWADSNRHDARRATITLHRFAKTGVEGATVIQLRVPAN
ncbi:MAG: hypothetical protein U1B82_11835 [Cypionkella sp.]|nr:hypothetical protein [Cypionkella sp.]